MSPVPAASGPRRHPIAASLAAALALALLLALAAVAWLQVRQHRLLDATVRYQDDYLQVSVTQLQVEFLRLRVALHEAAADPEAARASVQLRYDIFVSRADLLASGRAERLVSNPVEFQEAVDRSRALIAEADAILGPRPSRPFDAAAVRSLLAALLPLDAPLQTLVLSSAHTLSMAVAQRYDVVRDQGRTGAVLTALLSVTSVGFALVAFALLRRESLRRRSLEAIAGELREAQQLAEGANAAKSVFLANMSHEIRTPFQGMLGMLQVLDGEGLTPTQRRQLETVRSSATHLLAVLDDMLDMTRLEAATLLLEPGPVDLRQLLTEVHALMAASAAVKGLRFDTPQVDPALPRQLMLDGTRVRQILFNLISNAIKFTDRGQVDVQVRADGESLYLTVTDTGTGIDSPTRAHLFERFSLGDASRSRRHGGTGLGLYISRSLARLMGGDIVLDSAPGRGSRFEVRLPMRAPPAQGVAASVPDAAPGPARSQALRVLAVEDNEVNRIVLAAMLEQLGHQVRFVTNGREAVDAVAADRYDLILMDLHMPEMDGIAATRAIRRLPGPAASVPIIALSADVFPETRSQCTDAGMDGFLTKPVTIADLGAALARQGTPAPKAAPTDTGGVLRPSSQGIDCNSG